MTSSDMIKQEFAAPLGAADTGTLTITGGASNLTLTGTELPDQLYQAWFRDITPEIDAAAGVVGVHNRRRPHPFSRNRGSGQILLSDAVEWAVEIAGGASAVTADLSGVGVRRVSVAGGTADISLTLPAPVGVVRLRFVGSASRLAIHRPAGTGIGFFVGGGASRMVVDGRHVVAVGPGHEERSSAANRYELEITGGASELSIDNG
ncbi:hypothetical protein [Pseudonocardia sp. 73-21]|uniref:hypothetical protein n=1 Tax=Pseudonocardia sp. 73-21 TaxID=1895809 RepID=UPI00095E71FF|nr:hypothetical protein [Pseudonocardia sp. 73-21]OJY38842.1 MAG: hypothetical protein BGP03_28480 [Pseudonocardia sp. 73-21]